MDAILSKLDYRRHGVVGHALTVVTLDEVSRPAGAMVESAPVVARREAATPALRASAPAHLGAQLPNGVTLERECGGRDGALVKAMIEALGTLMFRLDPALKVYLHREAVD